MALHLHASPAAGYRSQSGCESPRRTLYSSTSQLVLQPLPHLLSGSAGGVAIGNTLVYVFRYAFHLDSPLGRHLLESHLRRFCATSFRSEERRVGKECKLWCSPHWLS